MKLQKGNLRKQGINLDEFKDQMLWLHPTTKKYELFTKKDYEIIQQKQNKISSKL